MTNNDLTTDITKITDEESWNSVKSTYTGSKEEYLEDCTILNTINSKLTFEERSLRDNYLKDYFTSLSNYMYNGSSLNYESLKACSKQLQDYVFVLVEKYDKVNLEIFRHRQETLHKNSLELISKMRNASSQIGTA